MTVHPVNYIGNASDFEYSLTCLGAGYVGGPTMVSSGSDSGSHSGSD